ncbi:cell wall metabolism sensor histidine kinase WalK [Ammoniphilus sp. CFH 90114]|uniref:sensor histidine kinase n=1 Tax=Ammoniphilus sp. CFH 90114 TaxID=2493665 RepID=UPI001F0CC10E|nr:HAMP domain-containing sensor histidine kinase [Ammoniphilus sp. CFH 90114]
MQPTNFSILKWFKGLSVFWKLIIVNGLVIGIAVWLAGVSVKDYACLLVNQYPSIGREESELFNQTMQSFLLKASFLAMLIAGLIHYLFVKRVFSPLKRLSLAAKDMAMGRYPGPIPVHTTDEIGMLTADFNNLSRKLQQTEEWRKKMVSDIAHELRTPLTNMNGYLEALKSGVIEGNPEIYESLHEESLRITRLVEQMHQLNIWESRKWSEKTVRKVEMEQVIETALESFALEFKNKEIAMHTCIQAGEVMGHEDGLKQVMVNLLKNVLQYDRGGWVRVEGEIVDGSYKVSVMNEGQPIPSEHVEHVFDRFYRIDPSRNRETGGSGLGLALVKEIVEQHSGEVGVHSKNHYHSFWFKVPMIGERSIN